MTQRIKDEVLEKSCEINLDIRGVDIAIDLISLRAAVRRVHAAEDVWTAACVNAVGAHEAGKVWGEVREARRALRAEMANIDGGAS